MGFRSIIEAFPFRGSLSGLVASQSFKSPTARNSFELSNINIAGFVEISSANTALLSSGQCAELTEFQQIRHRTENALSLRLKDVHLWLSLWLSDLREE